MDNKRVLHYLKVIREHGALYQPEIREAIQRSIDILGATLKLEKDLGKLISNIKKEEKKGDSK